MVDKSMSIGQVLSMDRGTAAIMMQFGMHCLGCPHATMESLEAACAVHGTDVEKLVKLLNEYFANKESK